MMVLCILIGLGLALLGLIIWSLGEKQEGVKSLPPPVHPHPRTSSSTQSGAVNQTRTTKSMMIRPCTLPPRSSPVGNGLGPRGIKPVQFPCCPIDKQRNVAGSRQVIFWDNKENVYRCSRGHQFKSNGKLY